MINATSKAAGEYFTETYATAFRAAPLDWFAHPLPRAPLGTHTHDLRIEVDQGPVRLQLRRIRGGTELRVDLPRLEGQNAFVTQPLPTRGHDQHELLVFNGGMSLATISVVGEFHGTYPLPSAVDLLGRLA